MKIADSVVYISAVATTLVLAITLFHLMRAKRLLLRDSLALEHLRRQEKSFKTLVENSPDIFARFDLSLRHLYVNEAIANFTGLTPNDFIGKTNEDLGMPPHLCEHWRKEMGNCIKYRTTSKIEFSYKTHLGASKTFLARLIPEIENEKVTSLLCITTDITEYKTLMHALRLSQRKLRQADQAKDEFLATLVHELRNPLSTIKNAIELQNKLEKSSATWPRTATILMRQVQMMTTVVDDLLDVARIANNKMNFDLKKIDVRECLSIAMETSQSLCYLKELQFNADCGDVPLWIRGDEIRIAQIFTNILNNAFKYTPDGGRVSLCASRKQDMVEVAIRDTGIGIEPDMLDYVFDMFAQIGTARIHAAGGLGIGLALVKRLTEAHGGTVEAISEGVGKGSLFVVRLPALSDIEQ